MKRLLGMALATAACGAAQPAAAITFEFYEGNNCTQKMVGGYNAVENSLGKRDHGVDVTAMLRGNNDEARSLKISTSWPRVRDTSGFNLQIYDSPDKAKDDDWVVVYVIDPKQLPPGGLCIGSFERNFDRNGVFMWRNPRNGLDGKVSALTLQCDICRRVLTPDEQAQEDAARSEQERQAAEAAERARKEEEAKKLVKWRRDMMQVGTIKTKLNAPAKTLDKSGSRLTTTPKARLKASTEVAPVGRLKPAPKPKGTTPKGPSEPK